VKVVNTVKVKVSHNRPRLSKVFRVG